MRASLATSSGASRSGTSRLSEDSAVNGTHTYLPSLPDSILILSLAGAARGEPGVVRHPHEPGTVEGAFVAVDPRTFETEYRSAIEAGLAQAGLAAPADTRPILGGRRGHHSEHLGHLLAVMQHIPRTYPDATW